MKRTEYNNIINIIDNFEEQEKRLYKEYAALNPYHEQERKKDMLLVLFACSMIKDKINSIVSIE